MIAQHLTTLLYSGNLGLGHELETVVKAVATVNGRLNLRVLFVGNGKGRAAIETLTAELGLDCVEFRPPVPLEELPQVLADGDIHLVSQKPGTQGLIVPSKLYGVLAAGRPTLFIGPEDCEPAMILRESRAGVTVEPGDVAAVADALKTLAGSPELRARMGRRARQYYDARFGRDRSVSAIAKALEEVSGLQPVQGPRGNPGIHLRVPWLLLACTTTLFVLVLARLPQGMVPADLRTGLGDKLPHSIVYGLLTWCWVGAVRGVRRFSYLFVIPLIVIAMGAVDEITQSLPNRTSSLADWLANCAGVGISFILLMIFGRHIHS